MTSQLDERSALEVSSLLAKSTPATARVLDAVLCGHALLIEEATALCAAEGDDLRALCATADSLRVQQVGDSVGYVVNRNINFTNVCVMKCKFCAFSRTRRSTEGYFLDRDEVMRRAQQAHDYGATEVCVQAGLPPDADRNLYVDLISTLKRAMPSLHIHAMSPEEVRYGAKLRGMPIIEFLKELKEAGLGSLPGTSAEILDDGVRKRLAGGRISTAEWMDVITSAHRIGLPTTATIMYGHIETDRQRVAHLDLLRSIQQDTGGFTEFVPLSFVHAEAPLHFNQMVPGVRPGPTRDEVTRLYALSRLVLGASFRNVQVSWVKEGLERSQEMLACGANDMGGTLMNESISTSAGAQHGQMMRPRTLRQVIREAGRVPVQRDTLYRTLRTFDLDGTSDPVEPLDEVQDVETTFGSYRLLTTAALLRAAT